MSKQDKATTARFAKTLRELVKKPENKLCADCKRNDPRWASWNLGVFLCIRCSGIHRGMGTHISKVKSVDLDVWTPEQMESIQKWGNHLANLYWEAHLKPGHIPPDHKMDSFIRSKYESKRWALEGPLPSDPSVLDSGPTGDTAVVASQTTTVPSQQASPAPSNPTTARSTRTSTPVSFIGVLPPRQQTHQLLSANYTTTTTEIPAAAAAAQQGGGSTTQQQQQPNNLFSLDFHAPQQTTEQPRKDVKQDILSLFSPAGQSAVAAAAAAPVPISNFATPSTQYNGSLTWQGVQQQQQQQPVAVPTGMMGASGTGMWGTTSGWAATPPIHAQPNIWNTSHTTTMNNNMLDTTSIWGGSPSTSATTTMNPMNVSQDIWGSTPNVVVGPQQQLHQQQMQQQQKKDDVFGDIWGGFK